jgi:hypothetical protein
MGTSRYGLLKMRAGETRSDEHLSPANPAM